LRQTLEAEAMACRRAVAWDRLQPLTWRRLEPWVVYELETLRHTKLFELRPRDWRAEYEALPLRERDRLRKKGQRQASPYFRRGAPVSRAHPIIEAAAQLIAAAIADGTRVTEFRTRRLEMQGTSGQLRYLTRWLPLSRRSGSPALDLLFASLRYTLPINTTLSKGLPERSVARVAETLTQPKYYCPPVRAYTCAWDDEIVLNAPLQTSDTLWARVFGAGSEVGSAEPQEGPADDFSSSQSKNPRQTRKRR
jgi:hypothetical protein